MIPDIPPSKANALPSRMVAPVVKVMLVSARMFPVKSVDVPSVAELPTCQNTRLLAPPWMRWIDEALQIWCQAHDECCYQDCGITSEMISAGVKIEMGKRKKSPLLKVRMFGIECRCMAATNLPS